MEIGKIRRLKKIFREDKKTVIVPMDHGVSSGPIKGLENMQEIVNKLLKGRVDAIVVHRGIAKSIDVGNAGLIVHLSGSTSLGPDPNRKVQVCSVEEAIMIGADAVSVHVNVGSDYESEMLMKLGKISDECDRFGMPLLAMMYPRGAKIQSEHALDFVAHAARLGAELGADVIKTNYTGSIESFKEVVSKCPVPVVIAGGPKTKSEEEFLQMVYDAIQAGAVGVSIGRNVFQSENPTLMVKALSAIVHKRSSASEAMKILGSEK